MVLVWLRNVNILHIGGGGGSCINFKTAAWDRDKEKRKNDKRGGEKKVYQQKHNQSLFSLSSLCPLRCF